MAFIALPVLAILMVLLNESYYLREYRASRLPRLGSLVLLLVLPLAIIDRQISDSWLHLAWLLLLVVGGLASFIDWEHHLLPDRLVLPTLALSVLLIGATADPRPALIGAASWCSAFAILALLNPNGLGWGDVKFAALLGSLCGAVDVKLIPIAIFLALLTGGAYALFLIAQGKRRSQIPFGPFMFLGAITSLVSG